MMTLGFCKCLICGKSDFSPGEKITEDTLLWSWKDECARTMCEILFGFESHSLHPSFKNSEYCRSCQQIVRDVNFTYRQLQSFQRTLDKLTKIIRNRIKVNYSRVRERLGKTENNTEEEIGISTNMVNYSYEELIGIIYSGTSKFITETRLIKENQEFVQDSFGTTDVDNEYISSIKQEAIKNENEEYPSDSEGHFDWQLDEVQSELPTKKEREPKDKTRNTRFKKNALFAKALKRKKSDSWSSKLARVKTKKSTRMGENVRKRGRPRKYEYDNSKPKETVKCTHEGCAVMFTTKEKMKIHVKAVHEGIEKPYECSHSHCSASFSKWKEMVTHVKDVHDKRKKKAHFCKFCGKGYENEDGLFGHYSLAHVGPNPFACAFCPEIFSNSVHLRMHVKKVHPDPEDLMKPHCQICDKYFSNQNNYNMHLKWQHGSPELIPTCSDCNRQFSSRGALRKHTKRYHSEEMKYTCETCGRGFSYIGDVTEHAKLHDESNKKYACKVCDKKFASSETCKLHEVSHTDIKEYVCQFCGRAFNRRGNLAAHLKLHSREGDAPVRVRKPKQQTIVAKDFVLNFSIPDLQM